MAGSYNSPEGELPWTEYVVRLDSMLETVKEYTPHVSAAIQREFPTYADFDKRRSDVYKVIARGFLDDQSYATYEIFIEFYDRKKPPVYAVEARRVCIPYQKRVMRTVRHLEGFYPDEVLRRKEQAAKDLEEELKNRNSDKAKKENEVEKVQQENAYLKSLLIANGIRPPPLVQEPEDASDDDVEDVNMEPLTLENTSTLAIEDGASAHVQQQLALENTLTLAIEDAASVHVQEPLALEDAAGPGTPILLSEVESDDESVEVKTPAVNVCAPLLARFALATIKKTKKPTLCQTHTGRRSVEATLSEGMKFVPLSEADACVAVPTRGGRGLAFRELVASGKSFFLLVDVTFICRPDFIAACSGKEPFKFHLEFVPDKSFLDGEKEKIVFPASVWICHTASSKPKAKHAVFTPVADDEMTIMSTMPDTTTIL